MNDSSQLLFGRNIRRFREGLGQSQESLAADSGLDRSYVGGVERGERNPSLSAILKLATALNVSPAQLFEGIGEVTQPAPEALSGVQVAETDGGLLIRFRYDKHDAEYILQGASMRQYGNVINALRRGLSSGASRTNAVVEAFLTAARTWPNINPSDLWTFLISRAYCDRANHPDANARLNLEQSWKRTSGWALERILVRHYGEFLERRGVSVKISAKPEKIALLGPINDSRIVPDKADVILSYDLDGEEKLLGVVHVKASIAERRTDDVPMSQALMGAGHISVFWTMDSKSFPSPLPENRGEFGDATSQTISEKRRDFEEHGHFSACFSYNRNTIPTPHDATHAAARIFVCDFTDPNDAFSRFLIDALRRRLNPP